MIRPTAWHARAWLRRNPSAVPSWVAPTLDVPRGNRESEARELDRMISERGLRSDPNYGTELRQTDLDARNAVNLYRSIYHRDRADFEATCRAILTRYAGGRSALWPGDTRARWRIARNYLRRVIAARES